MFTQTNFQSGTPAHFNRRMKNEEAAKGFESQLPGLFFKIQLCKKAHKTVTKYNNTQFYTFFTTITRFQTEVAASQRKN